MSLADTALVASDPVFRSRVRLASVTAAVAITNEQVVAYGEPGFARQRLAFAVCANSADFEDPFTWAVLTNSTVAAAGTSASDGDLEFVVASVWNSVAGP